MNSAVQTIEDASKEMRELPSVLPVGHHGSSDLQRGLQHSLSLQMAHGLIHGQPNQHHHQHHQHQHVSTSQTSHQHRQQPQQPSHLQSIMNQPRPEPLSPQHQMSHSPHPHPQPSPSPHPHQQSSLQQVKHPSLSSSHSLELDRQNPLVTQATQATPSSSSASSLQLHSQGVNTSESVADIASSSQRSHLCTTCLKGFRTKQQLIQHSLVHSNIRKYSCSFCDRSFKQLSHLQQHTRIHTGEKPYACKYEDCDRAFAQMSNLQHHMRNHEEQVKKEVLRIHKCQICHRSYTNEGSLKTHTMKMHLHLKLPEGLPAEDQPMKKRRKKKNKQLSSAPTMVPLGEGESSARKEASDLSSDEDSMVMGHRKEHCLPSVGSIPRNLVDSLNQYERAIAAGLNGDKLHSGGLSSSGHSGAHQGISEGSGSRDRDSGQPSTSLGLMGLPGVDSAFVSAQAPEVVERVAAAAAAAVSNQLLQGSHGPGHSTTSSSSLSSFQPHPQPAHSQVMDPHLRNQVTPLTLPPLHDQFYGHGGAPLSMLSPHAHLLGPPRSVADLPMTYGSQITSASSMVSSSHLTVPSAPHTNSRPPSALASPHHAPEALNFNH